MFESLLLFKKCRNWYFLAPKAQYLSHIRRFFLRFFNYLAQNNTFLYFPHCAVDVGAWVYERKRVANGLCKCQPPFFWRTFLLVPQSITCNHVELWSSSLLRARRADLRNGWTNVKTQSSPLASGQGGMSVRETEFGVFLKTLIFNSSEIVKTRSELFRTGSELISTSLELISTSSELISTSVECLKMGFCV